MEINAADWIRRELVTTNALVLTEPINLETIALVR